MPPPQTSLSASARNIASRSVSGRFGARIAKVTASLSTPENREVVAAPRGGALAFFEHLLARRRDPKRTTLRAAASGLSGRDQGASSQLIGPAVRSCTAPGMVPREARAQRLPHLRPLLVDHAEEGGVPYADAGDVDLLA